MADTENRIEIDWAVESKFGTLKNAFEHNENQSLVRKKIKRGFEGHNDKRQKFRMYKGVQLTGDYLDKTKANKELQNCMKASYTYTQCHK